MASPSPKRKVKVSFCCCCAYKNKQPVLLCCCYRPWCLAVPHAMFPPTTTPRPERSHAVEFLREGSRVAAFWDVQQEHPLPRAP